MSVLLRRYYQLLNYLYLGKWLSAETRQAILAAFGETDGKAVITAIHAYLNNLVSTDKTKAAFLERLINEDPMMVCSLGLQVQGVTMPIREMYSEGNAYIKLQLEISSVTSDSEIGYRLRNASYTGNRTAMYGSKNYFNSKDLSICLGAFNNNGQAYIGYGTSYVNSFAYTKDTVPHSFRIANYKAYFDGVAKKSYPPPSPFISHPLLLYRVRGVEETYGLDANTAITFARIKDANLDVWLIPFIRQGANGMIDTITGTFYTNANSSGSFTIEYTLPDGTPWTPGTPLP